MGEIDIQLSLIPLPQLLGGNNSVSSHNWHVCLHPLQKSLLCDVIHPHPMHNVFKSLQFANSSNFTLPWHTHRHSTHISTHITQTRHTLHNMNNFVLYIYTKTNTTHKHFISVPHSSNSLIFIWSSHHYNFWCKHILVSNYMRQGFRPHCFQNRMNFFNKSAKFSQNFEMSSRFSTLIRNYSDLFVENELLLYMCIGNRHFSIQNETNKKPKHITTSN